MAQWKSHEIQHWLDTTQSNVARALFESAAKIEAKHRDLLAACEAVLKLAHRTEGDNAPIDGGAICHLVWDVLAKAGGRA